jgi:hypothetical protein
MRWVETGMFFTEDMTARGLFTVACRAAKGNLTHGFPRSYRWRMDILRLTKTAASAQAGARRTCELDRGQRLTLTDGFGAGVNR